MGRTIFFNEIGTLAEPGVIFRVMSGGFSDVIAEAVDLFIQIVQIGKAAVIPTGWNEVQFRRFIQLNLCLIIIKDKGNSLTEKTIGGISDEGGSRVGATGYYHSKLPSKQQQQSQ